MVIDDISWHREHDIRLRILDAKIDRIALMLQRQVVTGADPTPISPPSSSTPTAGPPTSAPSAWRRLARAVMGKLGREALVSLLMWAAGKLAPALLAWLTFGRPALRWIEQLARWLLGG